MSDPSRPTENPVISELDQLPDRDREETAEWRASLDAVVRNAGPERAVYLMRRVHEFAASTGMSLPGLLHSDYINTVPAAAQPEFDGDLEMESRITALNRWNAAAMVTRGARLGLGGH
ncbi:pyruvate dehydrogenase (acetyl-transferring), homodimeric type, partial [Streptomyces lividans]